VCRGERRGALCARAVIEQAIERRVELRRDVAAEDRAPGAQRRDAARQQRLLDMIGGNRPNIGRNFRLIFPSALVFNSTRRLFAATAR
jgi:hypothetical protein